ncbi:LacI family DNA-binding transcriptional regulator [Companilactobacillus futsaii]|uniref:LacI family DNA-binding transcriptional regulator n=2 Tax=Companilactobacillus futsaii TaxID=938155 RepID=A0A5B7T5D0_9LACO|nr:LacI family DNA-binding transcriptional regulator [Companilactobacillus futsaii]KRK96835.1 catabolite control protein B [Companilactobacillus futsaii JCM 17355]QCX25680.1 LacI family DNA-binding transcriptional regulator [Companilactobacillus futsaii]
MSNIRDVAKLSKHSVSTVSRVINDRGYVADKTRAEIIDAMEELDYHPNDVARALSTGQTHKVGVVLPYINVPYFQKLVAAITRVAFKEDYQVILLPSDYSEKNEIEYLEMLKHHAFDGIIFTSRTISFEKILEYKQYGPITCCEDTFDYPISCAYTNRGQSFVDVFKVLQQNKFDHIGVTSSRNESSSQSTKLIKHAYHQVFGKKIDQSHIYNKAKDFKGGNVAAQYLLKNDPNLQVIFANSDQVAAGVIQQLINLKKDIPVIGQEDLDYSRLMNFSTIDHKLTEIGEYAFWSIFEEGVVKKMIPSELILRGNLKQ